MGMPQLVVTAVLIEGRSKSEVARDYGVSRRWVVTLVQRNLADGEAGLQPRSRRPLRTPTRTAEELEDEIVAIRKDLDRHGHEAAAPRSPRSGGSSPPAASSPRSRTNDPRAATSVSPPNSPASAGRPTSPTGR